MSESSQFESLQLEASQLEALQLKALNKSIIDIIEKSTNLDDLTCNNITEMLVEHFGRSFLENHTKEIRKMVKTYFATQLPYDEIEHTVNMVIENVKLNCVN